MPAFAYRAVDAAGRQQRGVVDAASVAAARRALRDRRLLPVSVEASAGDPRAPATRLPSIKLWRRRIGSRALATLTRQIATLVGSDVRIEDALGLVAEQTEAERVRGLMLDVRGSVLEGRSFAAALDEHPAVFPEFYRASIAAGEHSGKLDEVLSHLADFVENRSRAGQKIQLALLYPALLGVVALGMVIMLLVYVVPGITKVFVSRGAELPLLTRALIGMSAFFQSFGLILIGAIAAAAFLAARWLRSPANRVTLDRWFATHRPFSRFSRQMSAARFAGSLATLVQSAVPLVDALAAAAAVTPNRFIRGKAEGVVTRVREGASLRAAMSEAKVFPPMLLAIVASGEGSGKLGSALDRAATELDRELEALISVIVSLVEPAVLLLMGGIVMMLVLAILLPIMNINNLVGA